MIYAISLGLGSGNIIFINKMKCVNLHGPHEPQSITVINTKYWQSHALMRYCSFFYKLTQRNSHGKLDSVQKFIEILGWLLLTFFISLHNQLSSFNSIIVQMFEKQIHQVGSKNEWLLLLETFTSKLKSVFVLTFENAFS